MSTSEEKRGSETKGAEEGRGRKKNEEGCLRRGDRSWSERETGRRRRIWGGKG